MRKFLDLLANSSFRSGLLAKLMLVLMMLGCSLDAPAEEQPVLDYQVKAAMLYKFLSYTDWPENAFPDSQTPYRISVLGSALMAQELTTIVQGRHVNGRSIEVTGIDNLNQLQRPHLIFIATPMERYLPSLGQAARQGSALVVTENESGLRPGSTINLRLIEGRVGFDISLANAQKCHLKLSSRLLAVAANVEEGRH